MVTTDTAVIAAQLGRAPRGDVVVLVRCRRGAPIVIRTSSSLADGRPFPTLFWLTCPARSKAIARIEGAGQIGRLQTRVRDEPALARRLARAATVYRRDRDGEHDASPGRFIAGASDPLAVKCLHAHYAHYVASGDNPIGQIVARLIGELELEHACEDCRI